MSIESSTPELLTKHWALDATAADVLGQRIDDAGQRNHIEGIVEGLDDVAVKKRDANRELIGRIFTRQATEGLIVIGPCSLDDMTDYDVLFDYIEQLQDENPDAVIAMRANSAKPRTSGGWTGMWYSTDQEERGKIFDTYSKAFERGIPILTEVTQSTQVGALAPWLSGVWLGARDVQSTTLRSVASAVHLPVGVKNGVDGDPGVVESTIKSIKSNSESNDGSGVDLGTIASNDKHLGIPTGILPVGEGNKEVAIIARGYELPAGLNSEERRHAAIKYLSDMCLLGVQLGDAVMIDGTHSVPPMFDIHKKDPDRIIPVLKEFNNAIKDGELKGADQLVGVLAEVGPNHGKTDPNYVLDEDRKHRLARLIKTTVKLLSGAHES